LTSEEAVALIDEEVQALIQSRLDRTLDNMGNRQFTEEFVKNWHKLPPIELCKQLLRTFKVDDNNVSLRAQLQAILVPTVFNDPAQADTFQSALVQLAKTHGDDYTFSRFLPVAEHREVIKEWLRLICNQRTGGAEAFHEDVKKQDSKTIEDFVTIMHRWIAASEYHSMEANRRGNDIAKPKKCFRGEEERSRTRRAASDSSIGPSLRAVEQVSATTARTKELCNACGKRGHRAADCRFLLQNHFDANRDTHVPFLESDAGKR
jgi:hypothetical protein